MRTADRTTSKTGLRFCPHQHPHFNFPLCDPHFTRGRDRAQACAIAEFLRVTGHKLCEEPPTPRKNQIHKLLRELHQAG